MAEADTANLAEEIRLLVEMVLERAAPWLDGLVADGHGSSESDSADQGGVDWCPLCAVVAVVRGERPEFVARLVEQLTQLVALLRAVLADRWAPEQGIHLPGFTPSPKREPSATRVQRIPVRWRGGEP